MSKPPPSPPTIDADPASAAAEEASSPACVMSFNASDASGATGLAGDVATITAMGAHPLPVVTAIVIRDTAEVFDFTEIDADTIVEQARNILEDVSITAWKVGFLGSAEGVGAVAEVLSDYTEVPLVAYLGNLGWMPEDQLLNYLDAWRELILPQTAVLVGNQQTLTDFLLPDWDSERPPSARELAAAASQHGAQHVLVTGIALPAKSGNPSEGFVDNVLASPQGAITGEKFERFEVGFIGAGETVSAALAALLASGADLHAAVGEALNFLDQALDAGFQPGMGNVIPDRFFWALPPEDEAAGDGGTAAPAVVVASRRRGPPAETGEPGPGDDQGGSAPPRNVH